MPCLGGGGCAGSEVCNSDGQSFATCQCPGGGSSAGSGASTGGSSSGAAATPDGGPRSQLGLLCNEDFDCLSGLCTPLGGPQDGGRTGSVCTVTCGAASDCPAGWNCAPAPDGGLELCQCQWSVASPCGPPDGG